MTDSQIITEIERYLDDQTYNYAVLIEGEWGCGKTYFANTKLKEAIEAKETKKDNPRSIRYISLYGCKNMQEIYESIAMSFVKEAFNKKDKKFPEKGSTIAKTILYGLKEKFLPEFSIVEMIGEFASSEKNIFIIDDLERCDCPINEVFGYINGMVEHDGAKIIIIANEDEIHAKKGDNSKEIQLMVASNSAIKITNAHDSTLTPSIKPDTNSKTEYTIPELEQRRKKLFSENSDDNDYRRIKEKLIGVTLHYQPEIKNACQVIIDRAKLDDYLKKALLDNVDSFCNVMNRYNHHNLRTFQFFISKVSFIYKHFLSIKPTDKEKDYMMSVFQDIIYDCFIYTVQYKSDYRPYTGNELDVSERDFPSVDKYIKTGNFMLDDFKNEIVQYIEINYVSKISSEDPAKQLYNGYYANTEKWCRDKLGEIKDNLINNKYPISFYSDIVLTIQILIHWGFEDSIMNDFKELMLENISSSTVSTYIDDDIFYISDVKIKTNTEMIIHELNEAIRNRISDTRIKTVAEILTSDDWAIELEEYVNENYKSNSSWSLFSLSTYDNWIKLIFDSSVENLCTFRRVFNRTYQRDTLHTCISQNDIDFMKELVKKCDDQEIDDLMMKNNVEWLKKQLEEVIEKYNS